MSGGPIVSSDKGFTLHRVHLHSSWVDGGAARHDSEAFGLYDLTVADGRIAAIAPSTDDSTGAENDMRRRVVMPAFIDCHTHLDKGHIWPRKPNPDGSFPGALEAVGADRMANWSAADVEARMEFALKCAWAYGTRAIRTHLDSLAPQETISWPVFETMRERWAGRIDLQAACLFGIDSARDEAWFDNLVARVKAAGGVRSAPSPTWCRTSMNCSTGCSGPRSIMGWTLISMQTRRTRSRRCRCAGSPKRRRGMAMTAVS